MATRKIVPRADGEGGVGSSSKEWGEGHYKTLNVNDGDGFSIGDGTTGANKKIIANNGDANSPELRYNEGTNKWQFSNNGVDWTDIGSGGGATTMIIDIPAGAFDYPASNPAPLDTDTGTNGTIKRHLFDDTTEEFVIAQIKLPSDLDTAATVYFEAYGYAVTADGNEIQLRFSYSARDVGESWDVAFTTKDSGDYVTDAQQDELDEVKWNETVSNLGWAADDFVRIKLSRIAIADGTKLTGDWGLTHFRVIIPRS